MSSVRSAMCWQPGERYQSRYSWIWLFFLPVGGLVDRELDPAVAVGHDLRHQRGVVGVDDLVVVVDELGEAEDVAVEVDELVHLAEPDVADAVVDLEQRQPLGRRRRRLDLAIAGREGAVIVAPVDERVEDLAVGADRGLAEHAVLAAVELGRGRGRTRRRASSSRARPTRRRRPRTRCRGRRRRAPGRARRSRRPASAAR